MAIGKIASLIDRATKPDLTASEAVTDDTLAQPLTINRIAFLMQEMGYRGKVVEGEEMCWVESATNGNRFNIYSFCDDRSNPDSAARSIQFDGGWGGLSSHDARRFLMVCNRYNHDWRYAKATVAADKDRYTLSVKLDHYCPNSMADEEFFAVADMYIRLIEDMIKRTAGTEDDDFNALVERHKTATGLIWGANAEPAEAVSMYLANARAGYGGSMSSLGELYEHGAELEKSAPAAAYFFAQAAERGQPSAYYGLARILSESASSEAILVEAAKYALIACRDLIDGAARSRAESLLDEIMQKLDEEAQSLAEHLAGQWTPLTFEGDAVETAQLPEHARSPVSRALN